MPWTHADRGFYVLFLRITRIILRGIDYRVESKNVEVKPQTSKPRRRGRRRARPGAGVDRRAHPWRVATRWLHACGDRAPKRTAVLPLYHYQQLLLELICFVLNCLLVLLLLQSTVRNVRKSRRPGPGRRRAAPRWVEAGPSLLILALTSLLDPSWHIVRHREVVTVPRP